MENYLNILHYFVYRLAYKLHLFSNKINPILLIYKLPFFKRKFKEKGIVDIEKEINTAFGDKDSGLSIMVSGGVIIGMVFFLILAIVILLKRLLGFDFALGINHFIFIAVLSIISCYFLVFKKDKYLVYFKKYESWPKSEKIKYEWIIFIFIVLVILLFLGVLLYKLQMI